jgi:hypothetical protein
MGRRSGGGGWENSEPLSPSVLSKLARRTCLSRGRTATRFRLQGSHALQQATASSPLWTHQKGGFYHDGRFAMLIDVVDHYDKHFDLGLSNAQKNDLVEYVKGL